MGWGCSGESERSLKTGEWDQLKAVERGGLNLGLGGNVGLCVCVCLEATKAWINKSKDKGWAWGCLGRGVQRIKMRRGRRAREGNCPSSH